VTNGGHHEIGWRPGRLITKGATPPNLGPWGKSRGGKKPKNDTSRRRGKRREQGRASKRIEIS